MTRSYWAVIPAPVRYDEVIPPNAKILYAEISSLTHETGYCKAGDEYFHELFGFSLRTVRRLLDALRDAGYIRIETDRGPNNAVSGRRIYAGLNPLGGEKIGFDKIVKTGENAGAVLTKLSAGSDKIVKTYNNKKNNIDSPHNPPKGGKRGDRELKDAPDWKPERFAALRSYYPKGYCKDKQKEIRAWDKLRLSDDEIDELARGLKRMKADQEWQRGIGIPHLSTFLNGRKWLNAAEYLPATGKDPAPPASGFGGWANEPEAS